MARPNDRPAAPKHSEIVGVLSLASGSGGFFKYVAAPILTGAISGLAAGGLLLILSPAITESIVQPTCSNPRNLVLKPVSIGPIPSAEGNYAVSNLVDGRTASVWVPPREAEAATPVTFTFDRNVDLQLICVVNGLPTDQASYDRANKVRALKVGTDATAGRREPESPLLLQPQGLIQNRQSLEFDRGETGTVMLTIVSVYEGISVTDPATNEFVDPTGLTALAEVEFYVREDDR